ncbi:5-formyltetrahydrofolate cyclo-ligase [Roseivirga sp. BDSF3-8]|uniref:5-formyltetrahydrofolate cyclo-ligase n=1 Tax=Roseivirga sp. BDSF3-8 TaxID=3241598 RepID=UPI0035320E5A
MTKDSLRKLYRTKRKALTEHEYAELNAALMNRFLAGTDLSKVRTLHTYLPIHKTREPDTWPIIEHIRSRHPHIRLVVPRIHPTESTMDCLVLSEDTHFEENKYGIAEPQNAGKVKETEIDMSIVPLLAFDTKGYRVGYGKGYYDKFFSTCRKNISKVGLSFFEPISKISDINSYDIPLNQVVTPHATYCFYS